MAESQWVGLLALAAGVFCIVAAIADWDWFMNSRKAKAWVERIGRHNARRAYIGLGAFVALVGLVMVIVAPSNADDATTAQTDNTAPDASPQNPGPSVAAKAPQVPPEVYESAPDNFRKQFTPEPRPSAPNTPTNSNAPGIASPSSTSNPRSTVANTPNTSSPRSAADMSPPRSAADKSSPRDVASTAPGPQPEVAIAEIPEGGIDLLSLIDPSRDQLVANWSMQGGRLISPAARPAIMQVPVELPESYTVVAVVEELEVTGNGSFSLGINVAGNGVSVVVAGTKGDTSGLQLVDNKITRSNSTHRRGPVMKPGRNQIVCHVDGNRVQVLCNDEAIIDWNDDPSRLSYGYEAKKGRADQLKIGSWSASLRISQLTLVPQAG